MNAVCAPGIDIFVSSFDVRLLWTLIARNVSRCLHGGKMQRTPSFYTWELL